MNNTNFGWFPLPAIPQSPSDGNNGTQVRSLLSHSNNIPSAANIRRCLREDGPRNRACEILGVAGVSPASVANLTNKKI